MKDFIFLYPIPQIVNWEIENIAEFNKRYRTQLERRYKETLKNCIDLRYRHNGFRVNWAVFSDTSISDLVTLETSDKIINVGMTFKAHTTPTKTGKSRYPNQKQILRNIGETEKLVITGFHMWDCVQRLAKTAYSLGIDTLVDEDLTEFFISRMQDPDFKIDTYPSFNPQRRGESFFTNFIEAREGRPWLWQDY